MKFVKKIIIKIIHSLGFDVVWIPKDFENTFLGLRQYSIRSIIDVGANRGQFAKEVLKGFPGAHIYCFEPGEKAYLDLKKWAETQEGRVSAFNVALGDKEADLPFYEYLENDERSSFLRIINPLLQHLILIHQTTLDNFINSLFVLKLGLVVQWQNASLTQRRSKVQFLAGPFFICCFKQ